MSEETRAVLEYTDEVVSEIKEKGAQKVFSFNGIRFYECPLTYISTDTWDILRLVYLIDDSKTLLHPGGWGDQPAWLVEAVEIHKVESAKKVSDGSR